MKQENKVKIIEWIKRLLRFEDSSEYVKIETQTAKPIIFRVSEIWNRRRIDKNTFTLELHRKLLTEVGKSGMIQTKCRDYEYGGQIIEVELWVFKKEE